MKKLVLVGAILFSTTLVAGTAFAANDSVQTEMSSEHGDKEKKRKKRKKKRRNKKNAKCEKGQGCCSKKQQLLKPNSNKIIVKSVLMKILTLFYAFFNVKETGQ